MVADDFGFLADVGEGELGCMEEIDTADDHAAHADEPKEDTDTGENPRPRLYGKSSQARTKQRYERGGRKRGESDIDGAKRL